MRFRAALIGALLVVVTAGTVFGQGFQGGLRGSLKDAGGVVPGVEVTLTNEQTNVKRSTVTNERGEYVFANVDPGNYKVTAALQGYKTVDRGGIRIGTQQFLTLDLVMEVGAITESVTVTGQAPLIDTGNASPGHGARLGGAADAAVARPQRVHDRHVRADRHPVGRRAVQPAAGSDQRVADVARRRHAPRQQLHARRRADHRHAQPHVAPCRPSKALEDVKVQVHTYDAEMGRTGGGVFNTTLRVRAPTATTAPASSRRGRSGARRTTTSPRSSATRRRRAATPSPRAKRQAEQPVLPRRRRLRRADQEGPHLLLVLDRELSRRADAQQRGAHADRRPSATAIFPGSRTPPASR